MRNIPVSRLLAVVIGSALLIVALIVLFNREFDGVIKAEYGQALTVTAPGGGEATVLVGPPSEKLDPNGDSMICSAVSVINRGSGKWHLDSRDWSLRTPSGITEIFSFSTADSPGLASGPLAPGAGVSGDVCFFSPEIPGEYTVVYQSEQSPEYEYSWG